MRYTQECVAGEDIANQVREARKVSVAKSTKYSNCFDSESLVKFQVAINSKGYVEAEIVESNYGYSLRYASGLQNFGLIASSRSRELNGTIEDAIRFAKEWVSRDPAHRYVTMMKRVED